MIKVFLIFAASVIAEILLACGSTGTAAQGMPTQGWLAYAYTATIFFNCWGCVEASRWVVRRSPAAKLPGPKSDWTRLWLWLGVTLGATMVVGLGLCGLLRNVLPNAVATSLMGHFVAGSCLWLLAAFFACRDLVKSDCWKGLNLHLGLAGFILHALGLLLYMFWYPGMVLDFPVSDLTCLGFLLHSNYYYICFQIMLAGLVWCVVFNVWHPEEKE